MSAPISKFGRRRASGRRAADPTQDPDFTLQAMLEHVTQGVAMFDADRRLMVWNKRLQDMLGVPDARLKRGETLEDLIRFMGKRGDYGTQSDAVETAIREHIAAVDEPYVAERMLPDGRILEFRRNPMANGAFVVTYTDVTERRHNEYLLQDSARELRAILAKAPVALAVIGLEDRALKHVNARFLKLFGLSSSQVADEMALDSFVSEADQRRILSAQPDRRSVDFETAVRRADGGELWALISSVRFVFEWEPATLTSFHDISDRRRAEAGLREELDRKRAELSEARTLQLELKPPPFRGHIGGFAISVDVLLEPAKEVGGDLVDHFQIGEDLYVIVLGDVSNKGAGAALIMARAHSLIRGIAARPDAEALFRAPEKVVHLVNAALAKDNATCMFLTLFLASLDTITGHLAYVRAGHIPPFLRRADGTVERLGGAGGRPLGIIEDSVHKSAAADLRSGDQLLVVTDGITEAADAAEAQFGEARVEAFLSAGVTGEANPLTRLIDAVRAFEAGQPAFDDVAAIFMAIADAAAE
jgi:PAS domain S-box-containing protein